MALRCRKFRALPCFKPALSPSFVPVHHKKLSPVSTAMYTLPFIKNVIQPLCQQMPGIAPVLMFSALCLQKTVSWQTFLRIPFTAYFITASLFFKFLLLPGQDGTIKRARTQQLFQRVECTRPFRYATTLNMLYQQLIGLPQEEDIELPSNC